MLPRYHFLLGLIPSIAITFINPWYGLLFLTGSFLIDFDHYMIYVLSLKDFSLRRAIKFFEEKIMLIAKKKKIMVFLPFHNIETFVFMLIISAFIPVLYFLFFGMVFHYGLDLCYDYLIFKRFVREFSIIGYILRQDRFYLSKIKIN